jgi:teichoic acid transport system permease protein
VVAADSAIDPESVAVQPLSVDMRWLTRVGSRSGVRDYLLQLWDSRQFMLLVDHAKFREIEPAALQGKPFVDTHGFWR